MNTPPETLPPPAPSSPRTPFPAPGAMEEARERAIALLTDRYAEGALDDAALEWHLARLHAATTLAAVQAVEAELRRPVVARPPAAAPVAVADAPPAPRGIVAVMSASKRSGRWTVPPELRVIAVMSEVKLDLRHALLPPSTVVDVTCVMGNVHIVVPPGLPVIFEASGFMANATSSAIEPDSWTQGPVVRVTGGAFMGEVRVTVKEPKAR